MPRGRKKKAPVLPSHPEFPEKWAKLVPETFADSVDSMDKDEMEKAIIDCEKLMASTEKERDEDEKLQAVKEDAKLLGSSYKEVLDCQKAKIKLCLHVMNKRGYA